jgi:predicted amidohydrolase YtcJ
MPSPHADSPCSTDAFSLMKTAILRRTRSGRVLGADQAIRIEQAVRAMTINGAHQLGVSDELGSIEVGKWGDLQLLSDDGTDVCKESPIAQRSFRGRTVRLQL